jgi:putative membrane protein insertion efficiency factor
MVVRGLVYLIELYRHTISPLRLPTCRFTPTCSQYAVEALTEYGALKGGWLSIVRLLKCGPWHRGGWDPIPERRAGVRENDGVRGTEFPQAAADAWGVRASLSESETRV